MILDFLARSWFFLDFLARIIAKILKRNLKSPRSWQQMKKNPRSWQKIQDYPRLFKILARKPRRQALGNEAQFQLRSFRAQKKTFIKFGREVLTWRKWLVAANYFWCWNSSSSYCSWNLVFLYLAYDRRKQELWALGFQECLAYFSHSVSVWNFLPFCYFL